MSSSANDGWFDGFLGVIREAGSRRPPAGPGAAIIGNRYELGALLGEGGAALVYRARDRGLGRDVAVKILREPVGGSPVIRDRFQREAQVTASLSHPNVVALHDVGEDGGQLYLVMELVEGEPLGRRMGRGADLGELVRLLEAAARGVGAAHRKGIVHRDLKPANILVTAAGEPKVGDFGLARVSGADAALTRHGAVMGTPLYMAPEQVQGLQDRIGPATDVYALGAVLYEMLTGHPPHEGGSVTEIYGRIVSQDPAAPRRLNPAAPQELETIALKALDKEPSRRYGDAEAFADDLRRYRNGEAILAKPPGTLFRLRRALKRRRLALAVGAIVAAAGIVVWKVDAARREQVALSKAKEEVARVVSEGAGFAIVGSWVKAEQRYGDALKLDPACLTAWIGRANARLKLGDLEGTKADCAEALKVDPGNVRVVGMLANVHYAAKNVDEAIRVGRESVRIAKAGSPESAQSSRMLALYLAGRAFSRVEANKLSESAEDVVEALGLDPDCGPALTVRGRLHNKRGEWDAALADFELAVRLCPAASADRQVALQLLAWTHGRRGLAHEQAGRLEKAIAGYETALAFNIEFQDRDKVKRALDEARKKQQKRDY